MGVWIDAVESKARVIHEQLSVARRLAESTGDNPDLISAPYLELLRKLYEDEFAFAHLADTSDLVARFTGPAVSGKKSDSHNCRRGCSLTFAIKSEALLNLSSV